MNKGEERERKGQREKERIFIKKEGKREEYTFFQRRKGMSFRVTTYAGGRKEGWSGEEEEKAKNFRILCLMESLLFLLSSLHFFL